MKFIDEAKLKVQAGNGGRGCVSFRREKFVPFGGPDGGDGGLGGSVYLRAVEGMNTLADFRISRTYRGQNGEGGSGNDCTGHGGDDTYVSIPVGTVVTDIDTGEQLGDLALEGQTLLAKYGSLPVRGDIAKDALKDLDPRYLVAAEAMAKGKTPYSVVFNDLINSANGPWAQMINEVVFGDDVDGSIANAQTTMQSIIDGAAKK